MSAATPSMNTPESRVKRKLNPKVRLKKPRDVVNSGIPTSIPLTSKPLSHGTLTIGSMADEHAVPKITPMSAPHNAPKSLVLKLAIRYLSHA